jgi:3-oxoacyl-[acyl-carrier protein] reductase
MADAQVGGFKVGSRAEMVHDVTVEDIRRFVEMTGDDNPVHVDPSYASRTPLRGVIAHGMLSAAFISTVIGKQLPGAGAVWVSQSLEFLLPVRVGDRLTITVEVTAAHQTQRLLVLAIEVRNQHEQRVLAGESKVRLVQLDPVESAPRGVVDTPPPVVIVTGASRGIGAETVRRLARDGYTVVVNYRADEEGAIALTRELSSDGRSLAVRADLSRQDDVRRLVQATIARFGRVSALVHNASGRLIAKPFASLTQADFSKHLDIQLYGSLHLIQEALPYLEQAANPAVVMIGSTNTDGVPAAQLTTYTVAKAALVALTRSLALEFGPKGIRFNVVAAGMTETGLIADLPERARMLARMQAPLRQLARPTDIAEAVAFLLSPAARHITGETLRVCGGAVMI